MLTRLLLLSNQDISYLVDNVYQKLKRTYKRTYIKHVLSILFSFGQVDALVLISISITLGHKKPFEMSASFACNIMFQISFEL